MSETLSRDASELVRAGRRALRPTEADKARILEAVRGRVAVGETIATENAPPPEASAPHGQTAPPVTDAPVAGLGAGKLAALTAGVLAAVAAVVVLTSGRRDTEVVEAVAPVSAAAPVATVEPADAASVVVVTPPLVASESVAMPTAQPVAPPTATSPSSRGGGSDRLAEEVALLTRAEKEFHAGNYKRALAATEEHRQRFPKGTLVQERVSLRVQALCEMGRGDEAHSEASRLDRLTAAARPKSAGTDVCRTGR